MSWNLQVEANYVNASFPYNSAGSFINFFEGLAYEHVNFIFADALHVQESTYPSMHSSFYKFGLSEPGSVSYYDHSHDCVFNDHAPAMDEYDGHFETSVPMTTEQTAHVRTQLEENSGINVNTSHVECPRGNHNAHDYQVMWQDNVDPDNMTYEELLELGETVGTQSRGLSQDLISLLPVRKFKYSFFKRKKLRDERCVICQMEYKRGDQQMILPCKHVYHAGCGATWLRINKACPICYTEVFGVEDASKH
ncbi:E3 ubiquitin-protein ligase BIG BROTHER-like [Diospyros lotus]|uniref:E3 ubiquitin-protein ligase BIG BROTHER-like n=1 Tax=Diospyros lotus TaxID=55363 RepID=UPI00224EECC3|nr:E3 ubiquitin-protein ligase BIG BROTHER-like [Diospyros lotus]XP_052185890.1 E3 ubiquitin-protein ligase BIG BROTHER-like [Diospyros lotus]XP_052185891.1 E3 ubiquitin-protein ligase BIG BROTHER-like [Diospyros lotus]XP_052185892.1 E3 ubiquitin-protein ligase BIG BROTHER-like [Diospyros lotus]XP_052185894.1 E3 ubiquitin-protein ligase BIG BROTHER-like [Diospyros lotus]XP_052185895.1 E3 ubiquitin-protein ligase BIG BROTHER-like [Diospyros lotus]XP_052185896.1 E3 ubiquitin-protein ligase BIG 